MKKLFLFSWLLLFSSFLYGNSIVIKLNVEECVSCTKVFEVLKGEKYAGFEKRIVFPSMYQEDSVIIIEKYLGEAAVDYTIVFDDVAFESLSSGSVSEILMMNSANAVYYRNSLFGFLTDPSNNVVAPSFDSLTLGFTFKPHLMINYRNGRLIAWDNLRNSLFAYNIAKSIIDTIPFDIKSYGLTLKEQYLKNNVAISNTPDPISYRVLSISNDGAALLSFVFKDPYVKNNHILGLFNIETGRFSQVEFADMGRRFGIGRNYIAVSDSEIIAFRNPHELEDIKTQNILVRFAKKGNIYVASSELPFKTEAPYGVLEGNFHSLISSYPYFTFTLSDDIYCILKDNTIKKIPLPNNLVYSYDSISGLKEVFTAENRLKGAIEALDFDEQNGTVNILYYGSGENGTGYYKIQYDAVKETFSKIWLNIPSGVAKVGFLEGGRVYYIHQKAGKLFFEK